MPFPTARDQQSLPSRNISHRVRTGSFPRNYRTPSGIRMQLLEPAEESRYETPLLSPESPRSRRDSKSKDHDSRKVHDLFGKMGSSKTQQLQDRLRSMPKGGFTLKQKTAKQIKRRTTHGREHERKLRESLWESSSSTTVFLDFKRFLFMKLKIRSKSESQFVFVKLLENIFSL